MSGLAALMIGNPQKQNKAKKRRSAAQKRATAKLVALNRKRHGKGKSKSKSKKKSKKRKASSSRPGGRIFLVDRKTGVSSLVPKGTSAFKRKSSRTRKVKKGLAQANKATMKKLASGESINLPKGAKTLKSYPQKVNRRRRQKKNPSAETLKSLGAYAGGTVVAGISHKYLLALASRSQFLATYLKNRYTNAGVKALLGLAIGMGLPKVVKQKDVQKAAKGYMYGAITLAVLQVVKFDKIWKIDLSESGLAGIESDLSEVGEIELDGIEEDEEVGLIEMELGEYDEEAGVEGDQYMDGVGEEYVY